MKKFCVILFFLFFNVCVVNATEFLIMCDGENAGKTDVCEYFLITSNTTVCPAVIGTDCVPGIEETPLTSSFVSSINLPEGFILKNCKVSSNNAMCNVSNNVVTITPNSLPFSGDIEGTIEVQIPENAQEGPVSAKGFSGHVNYTYNNIDKLYVGKDIIDIKDGVTSYNYTTEKSSVNISVHTSNAATVSGFNNPVKLEYGENKINIKVTSQSGIAKNYTLTIIRKDTRSDDSTLSYINTSDVNIEFNSLKTDYNIIVGDENVTIYSEPNNAGAKVEYLDGKVVKLKYNETKKIRIKVTSEKGSVTIYNVTLTREDPRHNDATLKSLTVTNTDIKFNGNTTYNTQVENSVSKIEIKANSNDDKATISGIGTKNLNVGNNSFIIKVTAENGDTKNYVIVINRKAKDSENSKNEVSKLSSDNNLKLLSIDEIYFEFDKNILNYNLFVDYNINKININYVASSDKASVTMTDVPQLDVGLNIIDLIVVAESGSVKTYTLNITRRPERLVADNNKESILELINSDSYEDIYVIDEINRGFYTITSDVLTALKETGKTIIYEIIDDLGIVYQVKFVGGELTSTNELRFVVRFGSPNSFKINSIVGSQEYLSFRFDVEGDAVDGVHLSIYKFTQVSDKEHLDLYEYDKDNNKLNLILNDVIIKDNVIELDIDDLTKEYVIAEIIPIETTGKKVGKSTTINLPLIFVIILFLGSVISLVVIAIKKKIKLKKQLKLYGVADTNNIDLDNKKF